MGFIFRGNKIDDTSKSIIDEVLESISNKIGNDNCSLKLPTTKHFNTKVNISQEDIAWDLFIQVCEKYPADPSRYQLAEEVGTSSLLSAGFTGASDQAGGAIYSEEEGLRLITYNPQNLLNPVDFIATMAHELTHDFRDGIGNPIVRELHEEILTDFTMIAKGWGLFHLRSSVRMESWSQGQISGWSISRQGYLGMTESSYALAKYCKMHDIKKDVVSDHLIDEQYRSFISMCRYV